MEGLNALSRAFWEMPTITRIYMAASVATTMAVQLEIISPFQLYFNPKLIFGSYQVSIDYVKLNMFDRETLVSFALQMI